MSNSAFMFQMLNEIDGMIYLLIIVPPGFSPYTVANRNKYLNIYININKCKNKYLYLLLSGTR